jgi:hypothetical protein
VASAIGVRIDYGIQIRTKLSGIDPGGSSSTIGNDSARYKAAASNRAQFSDRRAVSGHDDRSSGFYLAQYRAGLIAKLALGDGAAFHVAIVAPVAHRSKKAHLHE